jgi:intein/homing endonuclease
MQELTEQQKAQLKQHKEQLKRRALFSPCVSKEHLHLWIKTYLGIDMPGTIVCDDDVTNPPSNSSPMDLIWEVYTKALDGTDEKFQRVLAYAARDSFKCVEKGTLLLTKERGLQPIETLNVGDVVWSGKNWRPVTDWIHDGIKESVKLTLVNGVSLTVSPVHRVWAWEPGKEPDWKVAADLTEHDLVCVDTAHSFGEGSIDQSLFEIGYLCGILQGDGCLTLMDDYNRVILTASDSYVLEFWKRWCLAVVGREPVSSGGRRRFDYFINSAEMCNRLRELGLQNCYSWEKTVPPLCMSSKSHMAGFISGLIDTDGHVTKVGSIEIAITAETMVREVQTMLHALGVNATVRSHKKLYSGQKHRVHTVYVNQNDIPDLLIAGVRISASKANSVVCTQIANAHDSIPVTQLDGLLDKLPTKKTAISSDHKPKLGHRSVTRKKACALVSWGQRRGALSIDEATRWNEHLKNRWVKVASLERATADFYDLTVDIDHSYWSNGIISHNTLSASILEVLCMFHLRRDVAHMAAIESQAQKAASYVQKYLNRPYLKEFVGGNNKREITIERYEDAHGRVLTKKEWEELDKDSQLDYDHISHYMKIVVATMSGANSEHCSFLVLDELDLAPEAPVEEAKMIPAPGQVRGELPITFMTSTRKFAFGLVQQEIDKAQQDKDNHLQIRHWNLIDVTQACPPTRHLPNEPKIPIYYSEKTLKSISQEDYALLSSEEKSQYQAQEGYSGCLRNCSLFAVCRGRLATKQATFPADAKPRPMLKPIAHVITQFKAVNAGHAKAQLMCFAPDTQIMLGDGTCTSIEAIRPGDKVVTHTGNVRAVTQIMCREYNGEVRLVRNANWKFGPTVATPEHPFFVDGAFRSISEVRDGSYVSFSQRYTARAVESLAVGEFVPCLDSNEGEVRLSGLTGRHIPANLSADAKLGWIVGFFLAEGHFSRRSYVNTKTPHLTAITFATHAKEHEYQQRVREFARSIGLTTSDAPAGANGYSQDIYNGTLAALFHAWCGEYSDQKMLHPRLMEMGPDFLAAVLEGFWCGDGTKRVTSQYEITTTSYNLSTQLYLICSRLGLTPRLKKKTNVQTGRKTVYLLSYRNLKHAYRFRRSDFKVEGGYNLYRVKAPEIGHYNGLVYNLEVEEDHSYIANGMAVHNCWKPSSEGLIYPNFQYSRHMLDPVKMYEEITGEEIPKENRKYFGKAELIKSMIERGMEFHSGMDWGYTHNWAVVTGARDGHRFFIFDVISVPELEVMQKIEMFKSKLGQFDITVWPDPEDASSIKTFKRNGIRMMKVDKGPGSVTGGIDAVRTKIMPGLNKEPELFFLAGDEGCELLAYRLSQYHWMLDASQKPTDVPDEKDDDECDALRYVIMSLYGWKRRNASSPNASVGISPYVPYDPAFPKPIGVPGPNNPTHPQGLTVYEQERPVQQTAENWLSEEIHKRTATATTSSDGTTQIKKGSFLVDL